MKKQLFKLTLLSSILFHLGIAQVGINTITPQGALDVTSTTDGLLIPRVALISIIDTTTLITPTLSEMVYNTNTSAVGFNQVKPGYYYWNGSKWVSILSSNSIKMYSGFYDIPSFSDNSTKNLCTLAQTGNWVVNLVGEGSEWSQRFSIANSNIFSLSGTNTMIGNLTSDISNGSTLTSNRVDILYSRNTTSVPVIGYGSATKFLMQGHIEAWTNDGNSKLTLSWWGHEFLTKTIRWNVTIINQ